MLSAAFTGHRPHKLGGYDENAELNRAVRDALEHAVDELAAEGVRHWCSGMATGVDTWGAEAVLDRGLRLVAAVPFPGQDSRWPPHVRQRYRTLLDQASRVVTVAESFSRAAYQRRNEWMVDHTEAVVAVWNGKRSGGTWNCLEYARAQSKPIYLIRVSGADAYRQGFD